MTLAQHDCCGLTPTYPTLTTLAGRQFELRPIRASDAESYDRLVSTLSPCDRRFRFFSAFEKLPMAMRDSLTDVDHQTHEAFVAAEFGAASAQEISGVVRIIKDCDHNGAEYAIMVSSRLRGIGLGYSLMRYVIDYARYVNIDHLHGDVMMENSSMLQVCRDLGFTQRRNPEDSTVAIVTLTL